ncbi:hypothetical protein [Providencia sp. PROV063]|uniref:hypothetical protein n=1 Tax=Providencia sp. PROV063 TaxID=2949789 RepID=UPI0023493940|nr:hypothetical protein [Providencia sp. PROV063]
MRNLAVILFTLILYGCEKNVEIDKVKGGYLANNTTTTIGTALDNWKSCKETKWENIQVDNKNIVQFTCTHEQGNFFNTLDPKNANWSSVKAVSHVFQFIPASNSDNEVKLYDLVVNINWNDGSFYSEDPTPSNILKYVYSNSLYLNSDTLDEDGKYINYLFFAGSYNRSE